MKAVRYYGKEDMRVETCPGSRDPQSARRDRQGHADRDLRLRPAHLRRLHPDDAAGRHPGPRVHGRGRRGRAAATRACESATASSCRSPSRAAAASSASRICGRSATTPIRTPGWPRRSAASPGSGLFGYSHMYGGYPGGQAEYVRVPFADVGPLKVPGLASRRAGAVPLRHLPDRLHGRRELQHQARRHHRRVGMRPGRPVRDQERVSARRRTRDRHRPLPGSAWRWPRREGKAEVLNYDEVDVLDALRTMTGGQGPDACIDAVGLEAHGTTLDALYDRAKTSMYLATDRPHALRQAISALPQGRHGVDSRRLRRLARQVPARRRVRQGADAEDGADAHAQVHAAAAGADRARARSTRRSSSRIAWRSTMRRRCTVTFREKQDDCIKVVMTPAAP